MSIFAALNKKNIIMNKYSFIFYEVENAIWKFRSSHVVEADKLSDEIHRIESLGFRLTLSNIFVKTFTSDVDSMHLAYAVVELPNL